MKISRLRLERIPLAKVLQMAALFLVSLAPGLRAAGAQIVINSKSTIFINSNEPIPIQKAVADLASDFKSVLGRPIRIVHTPAAVSHSTIWITFKHNRPEAVQVPNGWEYLHLQVIRDPWPGSPARDAVVLTGSDMRGTIYAIYQFSQEFLGVDPLYWWTDNRPARQDEIHVPGKLNETSGPGIRYRGLFINDEDLLTGWTPGLRDGTGISLKTWDHIFEAILRLKGNMVVPGTWIFPYEPQVQAAAERGLIISQHHVNVLGLDTYRWPKDKPYSFSSHPELLEAAWKRAVNQYPEDAEVIWSLGYRGENDRPFWDVDKDSPSTDAGRAHVILAAIDKEISIIKQRNSKPVLIFNAWREGAQYIQEGLLHLPEGITVVWPDDGRGMIQDGGRMRSGQGIYYHVAMMDDHSNHYTEMVPIKRIQHELGRAVRAGATQYLVVNTANIRPVTMTTRAVMELAWDPRPWLAGNSDQSTKYLQNWATEEFGPSAANGLVKYYRAYFAAPARYGKSEDAVMGDNFYESAARRILLHLIKGSEEKPWNQLNSLLKDKNGDFYSECALIVRACRGAETRWARAIRLAQSVRPLVPKDRREFFQAQVVTQVELNSHSNRMLEAVAEAALSISTPDRLTKVNLAITEGKAAMSALEAADYGKWKGFYTKGDWLLYFPRLVALANAYVDKLESRGAPENAVIRAEDKGFSYYMITAYQGTEQVQF